MNQKKVDQKMKALRKAVEKLPEFDALMELLTPNHELSLWVWRSIRIARFSLRMSSMLDALPRRGPMPIF